MKTKIFLIIVFVTVAQIAEAQSPNVSSASNAPNAPNAQLTQNLTLEYCYAKARENYPLVKQFEVISRSSKYKSAGAGRHFLPQLSLSAKASWQTDVTAFSQNVLDLLASMGMDDINFPDKDQYRAAIELVQPLWDGGALIYEREDIKAQAKVDAQSTEVGLYALYSQINQVYFGILLLKERLEQNKLYSEELQRQYDRVLSLENSGLANPSDALRVEVEQKKAAQTEHEIISGLEAQALMLSFFLGGRVSWENISTVPKPLEFSPDRAVSRPEINLFQAQKNKLETQKKKLLVKGMPQLGLFAQGAYANPGLNMFKAGFAPYFIGGAQLSWNFGGLYTYGDEKKIINTAKDFINIQEATFRFNLNQKAIGINAEIKKLQGLLAEDDKIIAMREELVKMSSIKKANGTLSMSDYLSDLFELNMARQTKAVHSMQMLLAMYELRVELGL
ncbi:MAG: TolC family protein [Bacteroidales bacterium]|jgi:outer membrane protein TolC|nr:TolC family protein [Bacteroidales bacterium]